MSGSLGDLLYGLLVPNSSGLKGENVRIERAFRRAAEQAASADTRPDEILRQSFIAESVPGAYDAPSISRHSFVYEAWRAGMTVADFQRLMKSRNRLRLRRKTSTSENASR